MKMLSKPVVIAVVIATLYIALSFLGIKRIIVEWINKEIIQYSWVEVPKEAGGFVLDKKHLAITSDTHIEEKFPVPYAPWHSQQKEGLISIKTTDLRNFQVDNIRVFEKASPFFDIIWSKAKTPSKVYILKRPMITCFSEKARKWVTKLEPVDNDCDLEVFEINTQLKTTKKIATLLTRSQMLQLYPEQLTLFPLAIDEKRKQIWIACDYRGVGVTADSKIMLFDLEKNTATTQTLEKEWNVNLKQTNFKWLPDSPAIVDKKGNLFVIITDEKIQDSLWIRVDEKNTSIEEIELPSYGSKNWNMQIVYDEANEVIYLANYTWDGNRESHFSIYNTQNKKFDDLGGMPTRPDDDVRQMLVYDGKLLVGFFDGLGVYSPKEKKWTILSQKNGLKENWVRLIDVDEDGKICITHDSNNMSCLTYPLNWFLELTKLF